MLRFLLAVPAVLLSFVWSLFLPGDASAHRSPAPPAPDPDAPSAESQEGRARGFRRQREDHRAVRAELCLP